MPTIIKTYEEFAPKQFLLPAHDESDGGSRIVFTLKELYKIEHNNVLSVANRINTACSKGAYLTVRHLDTGIQLIIHNEPSTIIGVTGGRTITISNYSDMKIPEDSIIINVKSDNSLFILSVKDNYELVFVTPKIVISKHDPYGEEDWGEE